MEALPGDFQLECATRTLEICIGLSLPRRDKASNSTGARQSCRMEIGVKMDGTPVRDDLINRLIRYPAALGMRMRIIRLRLLGAHIGKKCWVRRVHVPRNPWDIVIEDGAALDDDVVLLTTGSRGDGPRLVIGSGTYINRFTMFDASERIDVGRQCMIGPFCYVTDHDHGFESGTPMVEQPLVARPVRIGNNVWVGASTTILK